MGRLGKHTDKLQNQHASHAEIAARQRAESLVTTAGDIAAPEHVRKNPAALRMWNKISRIYRGSGLLTDQDSEHVAAYCQLHAEYIDLLDYRRRISEPARSWTEWAAVEGLLRATTGEKAVARMMERFEYLLSVEGVMKIDTAINKKIAQMTAVGDRFYFNPRARAVRSAPNDNPEHREDPLKQAGFGDL